VLEENKRKMKEEIKKSMRKEQKRSGAGGRR
jgi:hypothetical protein